MMAGPLWKKILDTTHHAAQRLLQQGAETLHSATHWLEGRSFSCLKCRTRIRGSAMHCPRCGARFVPEEIEAQAKRHLTGLLGDLSKQRPVRYVTDLLKADHPMTHRILKSFVIITVESQGHSLFMLFNVTVFSLVTPGTAAVIPLLVYLLYHYKGLFAERSLKPLRAHIHDLKESLEQNRITKAQYYRKRDRWIEDYMAVVLARQVKRKKR